MPKDSNYKRLIKEVFKRPVIYENQHDFILVDEAWKKIANVMGLSLGACKKMWKYLRETFESKHFEVITADGEDARKQKEVEACKWEYYDKLMFLESCIRFSRVEVTEDRKYDFQKWGEFSEVMVPNSPVFIKEEDPLGDGRILAESRRRKCTMKPKLLFSNSSDSSEEENTLMDDYVPNKILQKELSEKRKLEEELLLEEKRFKLINSLLKFFRNQTYTACFREIDKDLLQLLVQSEDADQAFLLSLLPALKRLPTEDNFLAKERIQSILEDLQIE